MNLQQLARCTGFPSDALLDFNNRGILPAVNAPSREQEHTFDGHAMLRILAELNHNEQ